MTRARTWTSLATASAVVGVLLATPPAQATAGNRFGSSSADATAANLFASYSSAFAGDTVVLARQDDYADGLAATPLAAKLKAPILLTQGNALRGLLHG